MHYIRPFLLSDEVASFVFGQALHLGQDFGVFAIGVELLAGPGGRARARVAKEIRLIYY